MIVLDTHVWLWWVNSVPHKLSPEFVEHLEQGDVRVGVASISCLEVALLLKKNRIELPCDLGHCFDLALSGSQIELLPLTPQVAQLSSELPDIHKDPADRIIITTTMLAGAQLATADETVRRYTNVEFAW